MKKPTDYLLPVLACLFVLLVSAGNGQAQTITPGTPLTAGDKLATDLPANVTLTDAPTWTYRFRDGASIVTEVTGPTCQASTTTGVNGTCVFPLSQANVDALNMAGLHSITATMFKTGIGESIPSSPLSWPSRAGAPTNLRFTK